ncbi:MAG: S-layer family protein, partial [Cyanobacteria bacterium HKST-UBA06]|nr:S-layer family protein [Cyanobacteria bacterium HKST-UBA06]
MLVLHPCKTVIKTSLVLSAFLAPLLMPASYANITLNGNMYETGTQASPYTVTDPGAITLNGNLTVTDSNGTDGGYVTMNAGSLLLIQGNLNVSGTQAGARGGVANLTGGTIVVNGKIYANGVGNGNAGAIYLNSPGSITIGTTGEVKAYGGDTSGYGGLVQINAGGQFYNRGAIRTSGQLGTNPVFGGAANRINIVGTGVTTYAGSSIGAFNGGDISVTSNNGSLTHNGVINATGGANAATGNVTLTTTGGTTRNVAITNGIIHAKGFNEHDGGDVVINSSGQITMGSGSQIDVSGERNSANANVGSSGNITLTAAGTITLDDNNASALNMRLDGGVNQNNGTTGNAGTLTINSTGGNVTLDEFNVRAQGTNGGNIDIDGGTITIRNNSYLAANAAYNVVGSGGNIDIDARNGISVTAHTSLQTFSTNASQNPTNTTGGANGGTIDLRAANGAVTINSTSSNNSYVFESLGSNSATPGSGGTVNLTALNGDVYFSEATTTNKRGFIRVNGGRNGGNAGTVTLSASDNVYIRRGKVDASAGSGSGNGNAGTITMTSPNALSIVSSDVRAFTNGAGTGGTINLTSTNRDIQLNDADVGVLSNQTGAINLTAGTLINQVGGELYARGCSAGGNGGTLNLNWNNASTSTLFRMDTNNYWPGSVVASTGNGGVINLTGGALNLTAAGAHLRAMGGTTSGNGGRITMNLAGRLTTGADTIMDTSGAYVANSANYINISARDAILSGVMSGANRQVGGRGGHVNLASTAGAITLQSTGRIDVSGTRYGLNTTLGQAGDIDINASGGNLNIRGGVLANGTQGSTGGTIDLTTTHSLAISGAYGRVEAQSLTGGGSGNG